MTTKVKKDNKGRSLMRQCADDIANEIIKALVKLIDKGGHGPVLPLTMTVYGSTAIGGSSRPLEEWQCGNWGIEPAS